MFIPRIKFSNTNSLKQKRVFTKTEYKKWRMYVLDRDNHTCQWPDCKEKDRLQVHHIKKYSDFAALRHNHYNGITLCFNCHKKTYGKEEIYAQAFTKKAIANDEKYNERKTKS